MNKRLSIFLFIVTLLLCSGHIRALPELHSANTAVSIRDTVSWFSDENAADVDRLLAGDYDNAFKKYDKPYVPDDITHPFWLKMQFRMPEASMPLLLITSARLFGTLDVYIRDDSPNATWQHTALGISRTKPDNVPPVPFFSIPFSAEPLSTVTMYARIETSMLEQMDWYISTERYAPALFAKLSAGISVMLGVMCALTAMYFALAFTTGYARGSLWLALMTAFSALMVASLTQEIYQLGSKYTYEAILFLSYVGMTVLFQMVRIILETGKYLPRVDRQIHYLSLAYVGAVPMSAIIGLKPILNALPVLAAVGQIVFVVLGIIAFRKKLPARHFYTLGMGVFWLGTLIATLGTVGIIDYGSYAEQCYVAGLVLQIFIFNLALNKHIGNIKAERERLAYEAELANAESRAKSEFLAVMSHEIRTPMNGVLGMIELLRDTPLDETQRYYSEAIRSSGRTLLTVINDILDFSKIEAGKLQLENTPFTLDKLILELIAPYRINYAHRDVEFVADVAPATPNYLRGDPIRLQQTIHNLLSNAFKFTEQGQIQLHIEAEKITERHVVLKVSVKDSGIGIDDEAQQRLFNAFQQAGTDTTRKYGGTGLGLAICKRLVHAMNGSIGVESAAGQGSTFYFTVELERADAENIPAQHSNVNLAGRHFLVIDDHAGYRQLFRHQMASLGLIADAVSNYNDALALLQQQLPDLIILDKDLPGIDGLNVARQLRGNPRYAHIPLLMLTASSEIPSKDVLNATGIKAAAIKPVSPQQLKQLLQQTLNGSNVDSERKTTDLPIFSSLRVLVAEDNSVNRDVIRGLLRKLSVTATIVEGGMAAVNEACQREYDLVLMDYEMPDIDGCEATRQIREHEKSCEKKPTPIYALTAHALTEFESRTREAGMNGHLTKPVSFAELSALLRRLTAN